MADLPGSLLGFLVVHPGAVAAAAAPVRAMGVAVLGTASALPSGTAVMVVGDPSCAETLLSTCRLVVDAVTASSGGLDKLAQALAVAATNYRFADSDAVSGSLW
jgi:DNA-binding NarL/FixJ family response regulator